MEELNLDELKKDFKTSYFAGEVERLQKEKDSLIEMMQDPDMKEMAEEDMKRQFMRYVALRFLNIFNMR